MNHFVHYRFYLVDDVTIPLPQTPRLSKMFSSGSQSSSQAPSANFQKPERTVHRHNVWFFADDPFKAKENQTLPSNSPDDTTEEPQYTSYSGFFFVMAIIDLIWFLHRMLKAVGVARLLLYGYPIFVGIREKTSE
jgi:hypothetical protein